MNGDQVVEICVALFGLIGVMTGALFSYLGLRQSRQINDAVNHRHERGPDALKLYDLALENHSTTRALEKQSAELIEWKRSYEDVGLLDTGSKVGEFVTEVKTRLDQLEQKDDSKN